MENDITPKTTMKVIPIPISVATMKTTKLSTLMPLNKVQMEQHSKLPLKVFDKLRTIKCSLKNILKKDIRLNKHIIEKLFDATCRTNDIIIHTYQFLRLWVLSKYENNLDVPIITENTIKMIFKCLIEASRGPKVKGNNFILLTSLQTFYDDYYSKLGCTIMDGSNLSQILNYAATDMITNIQNNIKMNFVSYVKRFTNSSFKQQNNELLINASYGQKTRMKKELEKDLYDCKQDLLNGTLNSNEKYHDWINKHKIHIFPYVDGISYEVDIKNNPNNYLKGMIYMCLELEKISAKSFQFLPLRTNIAPKYIPIDTKSIVEVLVDTEILAILNKGTKNDLLKDIEGNKKLLWSYFFDINKSVFKQTNYSFDHRILTDCHGLSIQLIHNDSIEKEKSKKINKKNAKIRIAENCKNMTKDETVQYKKQIEMDKKAVKNKIAIDEQKRKDDFKKLPKDEKDKIKAAIKAKKVGDYVEFPYLEELQDFQLEKLETQDWIVVDPGKKNLLYMKNKHGKKLKYSNKMHINSTKRLKYTKKLENYKREQNIISAETELSNHNSKTCNMSEFMEYIKKKNETNILLKDIYSRTIFRQYKWYGHINRKRAETDLVRKIKTTFGDNVPLIYGDWSQGKQMRHILSTPNIGLKRKLDQYFTIYNLDEFRTSKLSCKNESKCENLYVEDKKGIMRKLHSVLTFTTENNESGCINRDNNAVNNMIKLVDYYLQFKDRPEKFKRSYKFEQEIKNSHNPNVAECEIAQLGSIMLKKPKYSSP